jgi:HEAT repeat protein/ATP/ADP translocase
LNLAKTFRILRADRKLTLLLGATHFLVAAAYSFFDISATALLIAHLGPDTLPQVYLGSALVLIFVGLVILPLVDRLDRPRFFGAMLGLFAVALLISSRVASEAPDFAYRGLYISSYLMKGLVFLQFWLLAGDLLDIRQAKRLFPVLLGFSLVGGVAASATASLLPRFLPTESLLALAGALLLASLVPLESISRGYRGRFRGAPSKKATLGAAFKELRRDIAISMRNPLLRTLSIFLLLLPLLAQVLDFLLGKAAHERFLVASTGTADLESLTAFYAALNGAIIGAGVVVQLLLSNRIISSVGVTRGQLLAPVALVAAFGLLGVVWVAGGGSLAGGFFLAVVSSRAIQKVLRISVVRTSTDLIYNAIPRERRGRAKAFKETVIEPLGVLLGGLFLMAGATLPLPYVLVSAFLLSVLFLASTLELKSRYLESLVVVLKERGRFRFAFPSLVMRQPEMRADGGKAVSGVRRALENEEASIRLLAVEVASELKEPVAAELLIRRVRAETDLEVRARMLSALGRIVRARREGEDGDSLVDVDPRVRASGLESMAQSGIFHAEESAEAGERGSDAAGEADSGDTGKREQVLGLAKRIEGTSPVDRAALERFVHYLEDGDGATRHLAARALEAVGEPAVDVLTLALWSTDVEGRRYVIRTLGAIGSEKARRALLPVLALEAEEAYYELLRVEAIRKLSRGPAVDLLADSLVHRVERARRNAHQVLRGVFLPEPGMRLILSNLSHPDRFVRSSAIEALELRVDASLLGGILPLFEHESPRSIAEHGGAYFSLEEREPRAVLRELARHRSAWIRACAAFALGELGARDEVATLEKLFEDEDELTRWNAIEAVGRIGDPGSLPRLQTLREKGAGRARSYAETAIAAIEGRTRRRLR